MKENGIKVKYATERLSMKLNRDPTLMEVAGETALSMEDVVMAMEANVQVESIYKSVYQNDGNEIYLVDQLADERRDEQEKVLNHMVVKQLIGELSEMEQKLIVLRYYQDKTQTEVAGLLGVSQVQVSRLEKRILLSLRKKMTLPPDREG